MKVVQHAVADLHITRISADDYRATVILDGQAVCTGEPLNLRGRRRLEAGRLRFSEIPAVSAGQGPLRIPPHAAGLGLPTYSSNATISSCLRTGFIR